MWEFLCVRKNQPLGTRSLFFFDTLLQWRQSNYFKYVYTLLEHLHHLMITHHTVVFFLEVIATADINIDAQNSIVDWWRRIFDGNTLC